MEEDVEGPECAKADVAVVGAFGLGDKLLYGLRVKG